MASATWLPPPLLLLLLLPPLLLLRSGQGAAVVTAPEWLLWPRDVDDGGGDDESVSPRARRTIVPADTPRDNSPDPPNTPP